MPMMTPTPAEDKRFDPQGCLDELQRFVRSAAGAGAPVHEVERGLWRRLLPLGYPLQGQFFALVGDGDQGETAPLAEGQGAAVTGAASAAVSVGVWTFRAGTGSLRHAGKPGDRVRAVRRSPQPANE